VNYTSCPTGIVNAPVEFVWTLLTHPEGWGDFYNVRIVAIDPAGPAVAGQTVFAEPGPRFLHFKLEFRFVRVDAVNYRLEFDARFPLGITVREDLTCVPLGPRQCRVNYSCGFGFPGGWRGAVLHFVIQKRLDTGPADSLARLQRHAELLYANASSRSSVK
jgi:hypothetical protein